MFYKIVFWIGFTVAVLSGLAFAFAYLAACSMGMPDCIFN